MVEGVKLSLTEFKRFVSFNIFTDHYLFLCLKAILFGYLQAAGGGGRRASMAIENFQYPIHYLELSFYYTAHHGWARKNIFKIEVLFFTLVFANNSHFTNHISRICRKRARQSFICRVYYKAHHSWRTPFNIKVLGWKEIAILRLVFANIVIHRRAMLLIMLLIMLLRKTYRIC